MALPTYNGNIGDYTNGQLTNGRWNDINSALGYDGARSEYDFQNGGNIYHMGNNSNGTRSVSQIDTVAGRQQKDLADAAAAKDAQFNTMVGQNKSDITDFLTKYQNDTQNAISNTTAKYDIPGQLNTVNALNSRIKTLQGNLDNSGAGGFANGQQVDAAINTKYLPTYETAATNLNNSAGIAQKEIDQSLQPDLTGADLLKSRIATEMTGFSANESAQLQTLLGIIDSGVKLTTDQADNAEKLAEAKLSYDSALKQIGGQITQTQLNNQYQKVPSGDTLVNTWLKSNNTYTAR